MNEGVIQSRLDLLIRLQDTTTGMVVVEQNVLFSLNGQEFRPRSKGSGNFILVNHSRDSGPMHIEAYGFEPFDTFVDYEKLDERMPAVDAFLIPSENAFSQNEYLTFSGQMEGLSFVEAINLSRPLSSAKEYDAKRKMMTVYMPNRRMNMTHTYYGIANQAKDAYEQIEVVREITERKVLLRHPLESEFLTNSPIYRVVFGRVEPDGRFLLRVRDDGKNQKHLVRYQVGDEIRCKPIDFHNLEGVRLD